MDNTLVPEQSVFFLFSNLDFCIYNSQQSSALGVLLTEPHRIKNKLGRFLCSQSNKKP